MSTVKNPSPAPAGEDLVEISRKINWLIHRKPYMLCTFVWIISNKHKIGDSFWFTYITLMVYVPTRYLIDSFFRLKRGQKQHCKECFKYEMSEKVISIKEVEGMICKI